MQSPLLEPVTLADLRRDFAIVREWAEDFWLGFDAPEFFAPIGDGWSPADNVRHLVKSNRPVAMALQLPKAVLLLRFGWARRPSRSYPELVRSYREALDGGLRAGSYAARPLAEGEKTEEGRQRAVADLGATLRAVDDALGRWSEVAADRLRLPHPGLGKLTVREMVFFTLYHNTHHVLGVARRRRTQREVERGGEATSRS